MKSQTLSNAALDFLSFIADSPNGEATVERLKSRFGEDVDRYVNDLYPLGLLETVRGDDVRGSGSICFALGSVTAYKLTLKGRDVVGEKRLAEKNVRKKQADKRKRQIEKEARQ